MMLLEYQGVKAENQYFKTLSLDIILLFTYTLSEYKGTREIKLEQILFRIFLKHPFNQHTYHADHPSGLQEAPTNCKLNNSGTLV